MEIIKKGRVPKDLVCEFKCPKCKAVVRANRSEGDEVPDHLDQNAVVFMCPQPNCGTKVRVGSDQFS